MGRIVYVAPRVGAWIETSVQSADLSHMYVAPRVGAWIETAYSLTSRLRIKSHPVWVRGLKLNNNLEEGQSTTVAPRVGAWIETHVIVSIYNKKKVAPRVGAWIETYPRCNYTNELFRRTPCGCVD